ncbi:hypothetical protein EDD52_11593 [Primorskyibacter sedentarius]|uniref:Mobilization protein MobC n=1 Tax=Primorskyibacter sedentarius TaxID=745311 RepID=A0A4R3J5Z3_9RHOB|nr:hypothetical protein [Primorskyibacter sedentarius]TCS60273.1 hypothetical protein EDD52_11593 [Primorskyibacter sedentarius]
MSKSRHNHNNIAKGAEKKREAPFSLRLTFDERAKLEAAAAGEPLGAYIKSVLFAGELPKVRRRGGAPVKDHQVLGRVLAALGQSRLSSNLNQLARAVNTGTLPVHPEIEDELREACADIAKLRAKLIDALGLDGGAR